MFFETTKCRWCGSTMPMGVAICPSCDQKQTGQVNANQPRMLIAIVLSAAVLLVWNWFKAAPH